MKKHAWWIMAALMIACGGPAPNNNENTSTDSDASTATAEESEGEVIYTIYCNPCHGEDGQKGLAGASNLATSTLSLEEINNVITNGRNTMASFKGVITESEIEALTAHVETLKN